MIKMVQGHAEREEGIKLSPVGLLFLSMRGFQAHQRLNVIFEPILCCCWGSKIRRKVIAIRKTYNDLRVGSNPSGCLHGGTKILREGTAFIWFTCKHYSERPRQKTTSLIIASQRSMNFWQGFLLNSKNQNTHYIQYLTFFLQIIKVHSAQ